MALTFIQCQQYTSDLLDDPNNGYFTLPLLKMRLNLAQRELQKRLISANMNYYMRCVKANTVVGQDTYSMPTDFLELIWLGRVLSGTGATASYQQIMNITSAQRSLVDGLSGDPEMYFFMQNSLVLKPTPSRLVEIHLEYAYNVVDMVNDTDVPDAPEQFHEYIPILATRDCLIKDGRPLDSINSKMAMFEELLKQIAVQRRADSPRMIVGTSVDSGWGVNGY